MARNRISQADADVAIGYAADDRGRGIAYLRVAETVVRLSFRFSPAADADGRDAGYAALTAAARALREWGVKSVRFQLEDARLVDDLRDHRDVPPSLVLPYVRLRCTLNALRPLRQAQDALRQAQDALRQAQDDRGGQFVVGDTGDLTARARAEVALHFAA